MKVLLSDNIVRNNYYLNDKYKEFSFFFISYKILKKSQKNNIIKWNSFYKLLPL